MHRGENLAPRALTRPITGLPLSGGPRSHARTGARAAAALAGLTCALAAACTTTTTSGPASAPSAVLTPLPAVKGWVILERGAPVGSVVSYRSESQPPRILYAVRNRWSQDLGTVDAMGRAWRRVPHDEDEWLGTGTVLDGARRILGLSEDVEFKERPLESLQLSPAASRERDGG